MKTVRASVIIPPMITKWQVREQLRRSGLPDAFDLTADDQRRRSHLVDALEGLPDRLARETP